MRLVRCTLLTCGGQIRRDPPIVSKLGRNPFCSWECLRRWEYVPPPPPNVESPLVKKWRLRGESYLAPPSFLPWSGKPILPAPSRRSSAEDQQRHNFVPGKLDFKFKVESDIDFGAIEEALRRIPASVVTSLSKSGRVLLFTCIDCQRIVARMRYPENDPPEAHQIQTRGITAAHHHDCEAEEL